MRLSWLTAPDDRHDYAVLHDALKLRLRFGREAEAYCRETIERGAADPKREAAVRELQHALDLLPETIPTYEPPTAP